MLLNYLKLSLRLLARNPFFTFINVLGLSVGFAAFFILWQHSTSELKADQHHKDFERIARIGANWTWRAEGWTAHSTWGYIMAYQFAMIVDDFPQIDDHTRFIQQEEFSERVGLDADMVIAVTTGNGEKTQFKETTAICAEPNLFSFFTIPLIYGDKQNVLLKSNAVVLSQKTALKYFGQNNPIDQLLVLNDSTTLVVTGVFKDLPNASHLNFDLVLSNVGKEHRWDEALVAFTQCYVKLSNSQGFEKFSEQLHQQEQRYWAPLLETWQQCNGEMFLQPLKEIAFSNHFSGDLFEPKSKLSLTILAFVSVVILVMVWINYMNLTVSRIMKRLKEIATRKVSGALPFDLAKQFLMESFVIHLMSMVLALTLIQLSRQPFYLFFMIEIPDYNIIPLQTWTITLLFITCGIVFTALYPAYLSISFNPRSLLTIQARPSIKRIFPFVLSTFQYTAAFALILWGFVLSLQLNFILNKNLGIDKTQVVIVDTPIRKSSTYEADIHSLLIEIGQSHQVTYSHSVPGDEGGDGLKIKRRGQDSFKGLHSDGGVDETYIPFYDIKILAGRNFKANDPDHVIIVSRYVTERLLGYDKVQDAIGEKIQVLPKFREANPVDMEIIGVIEDYRVNPLFNHEESSSQARTGAGIVFSYKDHMFSEMIPRKISIRVLAENIDEQMARIEDTFRSLFPESIFNWYFLDEHINQSYNSEKIIRNQIALCTFLAIGIACLGLLGMIVNKTDEKIKEIGIRKVLGAELLQIARLLLTTTAKQIMLATIIGIPIAYYLTQQYLEKFSERISLQWWHFALPVLILVVIMFLTIASVLWKAAKSNPVEALKYE